MIRCELTEQQHTALLAEFKGMHQNEIARRLGSNGNAVYKLAHDVRKWLKRGMKSADHGAEAIYAVFAN